MCSCCGIEQKHYELSDIMMISISASKGHFDFFLSTYYSACSSSPSPSRLKPNVCDAWAPAPVYVQGVWTGCVCAKMGIGVVLLFYSRGRHQIGM